MKKKILSVLVLLALTAQFTGCGQIDMPEKDGEDIYLISNIDETRSGVPPLTIPEATAAGENVYDTSKPQNSDMSSESGPQIELTSPEENAENDTPKWNETAVSGERYVNTDYIYSRAEAIQCS